MPRILVPITHSELGGSQIFLLKLIDAMENNSFHFKCWLFEDGPLRQELEKRGIPFKIFKSHLPGNPLDAYKMTRLLRKEHPDIIYLHASRVIALIARILGIPCVERINMSRNSATGGWCEFPFIDRLFTEFNTKVLAVSDAIKQQLLERGVKKGKITVIRNFVETERFNCPEQRTPTRKKLGIPEEAFVVLNTGRFTPQKAQSDYLKIAAKCLPENDKLYFLLIGEGPLREELKKEAEKLELNERFQVLPFQKDIEKIYAAGDILLHTAHWDPLANVLLEAMAAGLVVIATDVDGTGEVIINNKTGLLFRPGDIEKATGLLNSMINAPASMRQMGNVAMNYIKENNSTEKIVEQYKKLFT